MPASKKATPETKWQFVFLIGLAMCIILGVISLGTLFMPFLAGITAVIVVLNALLGPPNPTDVRSNWFVSTIKKALNVTRFLKLATFFVWTFVLSLIVYSGFNRYRIAQRISVEGYVMTAGGDPADGAVVAFTIKGQELTTVTAKGKFSTKLDLAGADTKAITLHVRWHGIEATKTVDFSGGPPKDLVVTLPAGPSPLRISYFLLGGYTIDFLLKGMIDRRWEEKLSGQPYIIPNNVFKSLSYLASSFSGTFDHDEFLLDTKASNDQNIGNLGAKSFFVGSWRPKYFNRPISRTELQLAFEPNQSWNLYAYGQDKSRLDINSVSLWKFAGKQELSSFSNLPRGYNATSEWIRFYSYITKDYLPPDFCYFTIPFSYCGDRVVASLDSRVLQLRVALIENTSSHPIRIGRFLTRENPTDRLRAREADQRALGARPPEEQDLFPPGILNPGEKVLIPTEMSFVFEKGDIDHLQKLVKSASDVRERTELTSHLPNMGSASLPLADGTFQVAPANLISLSNRVGQGPNLEKEYTYGHSISVDSVEIDKVNYEFRKFDPDKVILHAGDESGSCPYIFTYSASAASWRNLGHILFGRRGKEKESTDEKQLIGFDGRLLIKENDPEVSFLDSMYVRAVNGMGEEMILYPKDAKLRFEDGDYVRLKRGDQMLVHFDIPEYFHARRFSVVVKGYYIPFDLR